MREFLASGWFSRTEGASAALAGRAQLHVLHGFQQHLAGTLGIALGLLRLAGRLASEFFLALLFFDPRALERFEALLLGPDLRLLGFALGASLGDGFPLLASLHHDRVIGLWPCLETLEERLLGFGGVGLTVGEAAVARVLQG
ncbi:hypothetical protein BOSEA31B_11645 [Hyphomicrobiales bacterium]|nr:hypothetical protein BOSEA31B_11645 [Hyphomicrobiales bacterium]CAH1697438.1 hypothetical protein BOSEA1005_10475 [Hyphomicrobiales bacterium]CAI0345626.1 hypothetical protein BO1005MUT1_30141 [Hyphomicrobiales bacterium]